MNHYIADQTFDNLININQLEAGEYEQCKFNHCDFSNANFNNFRFVDCQFDGCNFSNCSVGDTSFRGVKIINSKVIGILFGNASKLGFDILFENSKLSHSSFFKVNLKKQKFINCILEDVDFAETDLSQAILDHCDLKGARFDRTNLEKTDFRTSYNYDINPNINKIKKAKFGAAQMHGLLSYLDISIDHNF